MDEDEDTLGRYEFEIEKSIAEKKMKKTHKTHEEAWFKFQTRIMFMYLFLSHISLSLLGYFITWTGSDICLHNQQKNTQD